MFYYVTFAPFDKNFKWIQSPDFDKYQIKKCQEGSFNFVRLEQWRPL